MKIYHGSKNKINKPVVGGSNPANDYGPAFYMSLDYDSAAMWACKMDSVGVVNEYDLDLSNLKVLDLTDRNKYSVLNWVAILLHFRELDQSLKNAFPSRLKILEEKYYIDVTRYDLVIGYRADDAYFRFPVQFLIGNITLEQLEEAFMLGELGIQHVIMSQKGLDNLKYVKSTTADKKYLNQYYQRVIEATQRFDRLNKEAKGTRIFDILK